MRIHSVRGPSVLPGEPPRGGSRKLIDGLINVPSPARRVYQEANSTFASDNPVLGTIGIRAVVEAVCNDKRASGTNPEDKIDAMVKQGWLSKKEAEFLHKSRVLGNEAAHEIKPPDPARLQTLLDIIESLLKTVYVFDQELDPKSRGGI
jgi:hypothetical protein